MTGYDPVSTASGPFDAGRRTVKRLRRRRLVKFAGGFGAVTLVMVLVSALAFVDTTAHVAAENRWTVVQNLALVVATAIVGFGTVGVALVRPTVKQIEVLAAHTQAIESGRLDTGVSTDASDELGTLYESVNSMRETISGRIEEAETQRERAESAREESRALATTLEDRTEAFAETMARTAEGDLTARLAIETDDPASLKRIAGSFNDALDEIRTVVGEVGTFTDSVAVAVEGSTDGIDEAVDRGERTGEAIDRTAADARTQSDRLLETSGELESMSANIEEVAASTEELGEVSERAASLSNAGRERAGDAVAELHRIEARSEAAAETMTELESQMSEIERIVTTIREIAEQTNLLALNASIEAARAGGGAGSSTADGFEVVANEVKALSEETRESAGEVEAMITDLRDVTEASADDMRTIQAEVESGVETVETVDDALAEIDTQVTEVDDGVQQITIAMDQQAMSLNDVAAAVDELTEFSRETADRTRRMATATGEQTRLLTDTAETVHGLSEKTTQLQRSLETFEYGSERPDRSAEAER
jgi:methyl-accepting chemotaxis protein